MAENEFLALSNIATMLGISRRDMLKARRYLAGFPHGKNRPNGSIQYSVQAVMAWADGKDVAALVKEALAADRRGETPATESSSAILSLSKRWIAGEFATSEQKVSYAMRRLAAGFRKPKTTRITVRPD